MSKTVEFYFCAKSKNMRKVDVKMYCKNCGKEMNKSDKFCKECGQSALAEITTQAENSSSTVRSSINSLSNKDINFWGALATSLILAILMFQKWVSIPVVSMLGYENYSKFSLFELLKGIENINNIISENIASSTVLMTVALISVLSCIICLILLAVFCYKLLSNSNSTGIGSAAMIIGIILPIVFILTILTVNLEIENNSYGYISNAFELTATPYIVLVLSMVGQFLFIMKLNVEEKTMSKTNITRESNEARMRRKFNREVLFEQMKEKNNLPRY